MLLRNRKAKLQLLHPDVFNTHTHTYTSTCRCMCRHLGCTCHVLYTRSSGVIKQSLERLQGYINKCCRCVWLCDGEKNSESDVYWSTPPLFLPFLYINVIIYDYKCRSSTEEPHTVICSGTSVRLPTASSPWPPCLSIHYRFVDGCFMHMNIYRQLSLPPHLLRVCVCVGDFAVSYYIIIMLLRAHSPEVTHAHKLVYRL